MYHIGTNICICSSGKGKENANIEGKNLVCIFRHKFVIQHMTARSTDTNAHIHQGPKQLVFLSNPLFINLTSHISKKKHKEEVIQMRDDWYFYTIALTVLKYITLTFNAMRNKTEVHLRSSYHFYSHVEDLIFRPHQKSTLQIGKQMCHFIYAQDLFNKGSQIPLAPLRSIRHSSQNNVCCQIT